MDEPTLEDLNEILTLFLDSDVQDLHVEVAGVTMAVSRSGAGLPSVGARARGGSPTPAASQTTEAADHTPDPAVTDGPSVVAAPAQVDASREGLVEITAPVLGVFYRRPSPDQSPFVEVGDTVGADETVCIVDVMKLFNHVQAGCEGRIERILVEDGEMVEYGQALMLVDPST